MDQILEWMQANTKLNLLVDLVNINSHSLNLEGLKQFSNQLEKLFSFERANIEKIPLKASYLIDQEGKKQLYQTVDALQITQREEAIHQLFFSCHIDTVFSKDHPFQSAKFLDESRLTGPGVIDMKGGIVLLLMVLEWLENAPDTSSFRDSIGWRLFFNPDEEIGSLFSKEALQKSCRGYHTGIVMEPCLENGNFVSARYGSGNYTLFVKGKSAHVGRAFHEGKSAIHHLCSFVDTLVSLNQDGLIINVGKIAGGGALNVVSDEAFCRFNVRVKDLKKKELFEKALENFLDKLSSNVSFHIEGEIFRAPKPFDLKTKNLFKQIQTIALDYGQDVHFTPSGGVCDGNFIAEMAIPTIDTMGVKGGGMHTENEWLEVESLTVRAAILARYIASLAEN